MGIAEIGELGKERFYRLGGVFLGAGITLKSGKGEKIETNDNPTSVMDIEW